MKNSKWLFLLFLCLCLDHWS